MHLGLQGCAIPSGSVVTTYFSVHNIVFPSLITIKSHFKGQHIIKIWVESIHFMGLMQHKTVLKYEKNNTNGQTSTDKNNILNH
jgi:hypothetical protein